MAVLRSAWAQPSPAFEVASIKLSHSRSAESNVDSTPGRLTATNITVRELIRLAYGVKDYQVERAPGWVGGERYDIAAKGAGRKTTGNDEEQSQVSALLADRFQLTAHRETKQMQVYLLVVARNGPKMTLHNDGTGAKTRRGCGHLAGTRVTMDVLAAVLSKQFERDVLNRTGLPGKYDFQLDWMPDSGPCPAADGQVAAAAAGASGLPSIHSAVQEQLGLRLESARGPVDILVIDLVERPTGN
jgi:uncharacterized protein (TIGR03435 family)